jgi:hypothetical protein
VAVKTAYEGISLVEEGGSPYRAVDQRIDRITGGIVVAKYSLSNRGKTRYRREVLVVLDQSDSASFLRVFDESDVFHFRDMCVKERYVSRCNVIW